MVPRIAATSFLSSLPLVDSLREDPGMEAEVMTVLPSEIGSLLYEDEADVALLPVVEHFRGAGAAGVPGIGIAAEGRIESAKLFTRVSMASVDRVEVDRASRTGVALLRILLAELFGIHPDLFVVEPRAETLLDNSDAALVVGDRCFEVEKHLRESGREDVKILDLGELWHELTGLPLVLATWEFGPGFIARNDPEDRRRVAEMLGRARDRSLAGLDTLVAREADAGRLGPGGVQGASGLRRYFDSSLVYSLGEREMAGLHRFYELCVSHAICPGGRAPRLALSQAE